ncbi:hypothetical protein ACFHPP_31125, partial [Falsiroseomonas sp. E2-1-a20]
QDRLDGLDCGASNYLIKPIRIADLLVRLRAQLPAFDAAAAVAAHSCHDRPAARRRTAIALASRPPGLRT